MMKYVKLLLFVFIFINGCRDKITNPLNNSDNVLCYEKSYNNNWEIFTNNIDGTNPQNISNYTYDDEYPQWSPDGRYIVYSRRLLNDICEVVVYDSKTKTNTNLTNDSVDAGLTPQWTSNGKIFYYARSSYNVYDPGAMYIMNSDGSNRRKILDTSATIYFYVDSYTFLYIIGTEVYKTNIDNTYNTLFFELPSSGSDNSITIRDFNPLTEEFLVNTSNVSGSYSAIATYNVETKQLTPLITAEDGYAFYFPKYSKDYTKIAFVEHSNSIGEYLSIFESGSKRRLVYLPKSSPQVNFSYNPMEFSPDGKYLAFSEQIWHTGQWVSFSTPLYIVNLTNLALHKLEDEAHHPSWNPQQ